LAEAQKTRYLVGVLVEPLLRRRTAQAGFSLVELMAVVIITGLLATVGVVGFRKYVLSAKGAEAESVIQAIRGAEESYAAENHVYLDVSTGDNWYPVIVKPGKTTSTWNPPPPTHPDGPKWVKLAPAINRTVQFGYMVNAGLAGAQLPLLKFTADPGFAIPTQNWYIIQAMGDMDGDGISANYVSTSMTGEIYSERVGE
jgi:type IV pilus assembly protein PilA